MLTLVEIGSLPEIRLWRTAARPPDVGIVGLGQVRSVCERSSRVSHGRPNPDSSALTFSSQSQIDQTAPARPGEVDLRLVKD